MTAGLSVPLHWFEALDSTNEEARRRIAAGTTEPSWIVSAVQSQGRGREARNWTSPSGNFSGTRLFPVPGDLSQTTGLSLVIGVAVAEVLSSLVPKGGPQVTCKWPNDILVGRAKMCGILIESYRAPNGQYWLALGMGVNLATAPDVPDRETTSLSKLGHAIAPIDFLPHLDAALQEHLIDWSSNGLSPTLKKWEVHAYGLGENVRARVNESWAAGIFLGISVQGAARVRLDSGRETVVHAGELKFLSLEQGA